MDLRLSPAWTARAAVLRPFACAFASFCLALLAPVASAQPFTHVTDGPVAADVGSSTSGSWADFDGDGDLDLFVTRWAGDFNSLYRNDGGQGFTTVSQPGLTDVPSQSVSGAWADFDDDGDLDLFVPNLGGTPYLVRNTGQGTLMPVYDDPITTTWGRFKTGAWGDYDDDGDLDLFVTSEDGPNRLFRNDDNGFTDVPNHPLMRAGYGSTVASWADYDNDGDLDLFAANGGGLNNELYRKDDGTFVRIYDSPITLAGGRSTSTSWGDYDNDGDLDLFVANGGGLNNELYRNDGGGVMNRVTFGPIATDGGYSNHSVWVDYDNDGDLDLYVSNLFDVNFLYANHGGDGFTRVTGEPLTDLAASSYSSAWGDYDDDGDLDAFVANGYDAQNRLFRNDGNGNHWLRLKLVGTTSNRSAFGSTVRARATIRGQAVWQMREIAQEDGIGRNSLDVSFGLGDAAQVDTLRIKWPSGHVQVLTSVSADQFLTITEGQPLAPYATVQFVNDYFDPSSISVRIFRDGEPLAPPVVRHRGTSFVALPPDTPLQLDFVRDGFPPLLLTRTLTLEPAETYVVVLTASAGGQGVPDLFAYEPGRRAATDPARTDLLLFRDAGGPASVDVTTHDGRRLGGGLAPLRFGAGYETVEASLLLVDVGTGEGAKSYLLDLSRHAGRAGIAVVSAGSMAPGDDPGLYVVFANGDVAFSLPVLRLVDARGGAEAVPGRTAAVEGVVTRVNRRTVWLQDATAGLAVVAAEGSAFAAEIAADRVLPGDRLAVAGSLGALNNRQQLTDVRDVFVVRSRENALPTAQPVTLATLTAEGERYEGEIVRVEGLQLVPLRDGLLSPETSYTLRDAAGPSPVVLHISASDATDTDGMLAPFGLFAFEGVLDQSSPFNRTTGYRLLALDAGDLAPAPSARLQVTYLGDDVPETAVDVFADTTRVAALPTGTAAPLLALPAGPVDFSVRPGGSGVDPETCLDADLDDGATARILVTGAEAPFGCALFVDAATVPGDGTVGLGIVHAAPTPERIDLTALDVLFPGSRTPLATGLPSGAAAYVNDLPPVRYTLEARDADAPVLRSVSDINLTGLAGQTVTLFTTGDLDAPGSSLTLLLAPPGGGPLVPARIVSSVDVDAGSEVPEQLRIAGTFPNPFGVAAEIRFDLPEAADVRVEVVDLLGRTVLVVPAGRLEAGAARSLRVDAASLAAGLYLYRLTADAAGTTYTATGRFVVVR